jgi:phosphatidate cytidylyltransferase
MKNFIIRTITGVLFVAAIVTCFLRAEAMILLFALVTGLTIWEFTGLVNEREHITINRIYPLPRVDYLPAHRRTLPDSR